MIFKSHIQPLCRYCGKPIAKWTTLVYVKEEPTQYDHPNSWCRYVYGKLLNKKDCQRHTNSIVVGLKYSADYDMNLGRYDPSTRHVTSFSEWDGETYVDSYFCSKTCAHDFGRLAAKHNAVTSVAYADAVRKQRGEKVA